MAAYRDAGLPSLGAQVLGLSVDEPGPSEDMRRELDLPFPILCDPGRTVIEPWGLLNTGEKGGIAYPAVFVLDRDRRIRYRSLDRTASRVTAEALQAFLRGGLKDEPAPPRRHTIVPHLGEWFQAIRSALRHGTRTPRR